MLASVVATIDANERRNSADCLAADSSSRMSRPIGPRFVESTIVVSGSSAPTARETGGGSSNPACAASSKGSPSPT